MKKQPPPSDREPGQNDVLTISREAVCSLIEKLREFEVKDVETDPDSSSNASDDNMISVLEHHRDDPILQELTAMISALDQDEQIDLVALAWLGRDDSTADDWPSLRAEAARAWRPTRHHTANYLIGMPLVSEYLEEGLSVLGESCTD